jgi:DNA-binding NarL/FixJ family response regulator
MAVRVLVVDDDSSFRSAAMEILRARGFEVVGEARDGMQAISAMALLRPDGVLLDVHLPDGDGFELVGRLGARVGRPRVLLTSSDAYAGSQELAERCGAVGFVAKTELMTADLERYLSPSAGPGPS